MTFSKQLIALRTIVIKEILRFARIWVQTILPSAITVALYFIIMGKFIGSQINDIDGYSYIEFIAPGLIMMGIITNSYANSVSSFYSSKFQRHIEEMLVSPMPNYIIILGFMLGGIARGIIVGVAVCLGSVVFYPTSNSQRDYRINYFSINCSPIFNCGANQCYFRQKL